MKNLINKLKNLSSPQYTRGKLENIDYYFNFLDVEKILVVVFTSADNSIKKINIQKKDYKPKESLMLESFDVNYLIFSETEAFTWYQEKNFINFLKKASPYLKLFSNKVGFGISMGYAIGAFSNLLELKKILLIVPQSFAPSYCKTRHLFNDDRFKNVLYKNADLSNEIYDASKTKAKGYILYDPTDKLDKMHALRFKGLTKLKIQGLSHDGLVIFLLRSSFFKDLISRFIFNKIKPSWFYKKIREKRYSTQFYINIKNNKDLFLTPKRLTVLNKYEKYSKRSNGKDNLEKKLNQVFSKLLTKSLQHSKYNKQYSIELLNLAITLKPKNKKAILLKQELLKNRNNKFKSIKKLFNIMKYIKNKLQTL